MCVHTYRCLHTYTAPTVPLSIPLLSVFFLPCLCVCKPTYLLVGVRLSARTPVQSQAVPINFLMKSLMNSRHYPLPDLRLLKLSTQVECITFMAREKSRRASSNFSRVRLEPCSLVYFYLSVVISVLLLFILFFALF